LLTEDGYTVDFRRLSISFVENAKKLNPDFAVYLSTKVEKIIRSDGTFLIKTDKGEFQSESVVVAARSHSLKFAKSSDMVKTIQFFQWPAVSIPDQKY